MNAHRCVTQNCVFVCGCRYYGNALNLILNFMLALELAQFFVRYICVYAEMEASFQHFEIEARMPLDANGVKSSSELNFCNLMRM